MNRLLLSVNLVACEGVDAAKSIAPIFRSIRGIQFRRVFLFAPTFPDILKDVITDFIPVKWDYEQWNRFMVKELNQHIPEGEFALNIHDDGHVLNPGAWTDEFLHWDYIGAPWWYTEGHNVGNGGFSLRSKHYLETTAREINLDRYHPEDHRCIRENGDMLETHGVRFAPEELARRFALEGNVKQGTKWDGQFGFHNDEITDISRFLAAEKSEVVDMPVRLND